ncbi:ankyrin repeat-containing domain protein, partial [Ilyonectria destructans]
IFLNTGKVDIDSRDKNGRTPLSWATENGHEAVVRMLLDTGMVDVDSRDGDGRTLSWAAENGHEAVAKMLLDTGKADIAAEDACGLTALQLAAFNRHTGMEELLIARRAPIVPDFYGLQTLFQEPTGIVECAAVVSERILIQPPVSHEHEPPKVAKDV